MCVNKIWNYIAVEQSRGTLIPAQPANSEDSSFSLIYIQLTTHS